MNEFENFFVVDSIPLEVCKISISRSARSKICKEADYTIPNKGFCASQKICFYGYKLHAVCSLNGIFQAIDISPASVDDIHFRKTLKIKYLIVSYLETKVIYLNLFKMIYLMK